MSGKRVQKGVDRVSINFHIERNTYEKLIKLKIAEGDDSSFTKFLNKKMAQLVNANKVLIEGYEVDYSDFE
jgi:hypothetical protein